MYFLPKASPVPAATPNNAQKEFSSYKRNKQDSMAISVHIIANKLLETDSFTAPFRRPLRMRDIYSLFAFRFKASKGVNQIAV